MARSQGAAVRPTLVALAPVTLLAAVCLAAVAATRPEQWALTLSRDRRRHRGGRRLGAGAGRAMAPTPRGPGRGGDRRRRRTRSCRRLAGGAPPPAGESAAPATRADHEVGADAVALATTTLDRLVATSTHLLDEERRRRRAIADLFVNVGRRNQNLVGRQLKLLDRLEETETDPETLAALFRLDHFSTRMRRNAESLLVVAGLEPPRRWRQPVPVREVARAAAAESEEFDRVELGAFPVVALAGDVVATIVHLLAELIDNAVRFSPPDTRVTVSARADGDELTVVVADNGVGMAPVAVEQANARLAAASPEGSDIPDAQLGLYVVGRLAARVGVAVELASAGGDGVTASVRIPPRFLEAAPTSAVDSSAPTDARRTVAAAERAANGSTDGRTAGGSSRRPANGAHQADARPSGAPPSAVRPIRAEAATGLAAADSNGDRTASGFRRRQPKAAGPEHEPRSPSRLRAPDPTSAEERRDRLERFSAGKATAEEVMTLRTADGVGADGTADGVGVDGAVDDVGGEGEAG